MVSPAEPAVTQPARLRRVLRSFGYAFEGIGVMLRTQPNFLVHLAAAAIVIVFGVILRLGSVEFAVLVLTIGMVLVIECLNTALETLCDLVSPGYHSLVKRAKDISAAAVLIAATGSVIIALLVFAPHLATLIR